jgi:hypothetical protein
MRHAYLGEAPDSTACSATAKSSTKEIAEQAHADAEEARDHVDEVEGGDADQAAHHNFHEQRRGAEDAGPVEQKRHEEQAERGGRGLERDARCAGLDDAADGSEEESLADRVDTDEGGVAGLRERDDEAENEADDATANGDSHGRLGGEPRDPTADAEPREREAQSGQDHEDSRAVNDAIEGDGTGIRAVRSATNDRIG